MAKTLNVCPHMNEPGHFPSLAKFMLIDINTKHIMQEDGRLFADPDAPEEANVVDIIDRPSGFEREDFLDDALYLNTVPFYVQATAPDTPEMDEKVRVLNPIASMRSRFSNLLKLHRDPVIEIARINALKIPCYYFLLEQFDEQPYAQARKIFLSLYALAGQEDYLRVQVFWYTWQGPRLKGEQSHDVALYEVLKAVYDYLDSHIEDFEIPTKFVTEELPRKLTALRERFTRYISLCTKEAARKGRKGFERN